MRMMQRELLGSRSARMLAFVLVLAALVRIFAEYRDCGLVGWDTYPIIEASRVQSPADLLDLVSMNLMGRETGGLYYRPLLKFSLAIDYALWGLWAPGYQLSNALLFAAAALALFALASRLTRGGLVLGPLIVLTFFLIHPVHATVVPVPARRADTLCLLFMLLSLAAQAKAAPRPPWRAWLPAAFGALALASKETAFVLPLLSALVALGVSREPTPARRILKAGIAVLPLIGVVAVMFLLRFAILGGIVGERPLQQEALVPATLSMLGRVATWALSGRAFVGQASLSPLTLIALALLGAASLAAGVLASHARRIEAYAATIWPLAISIGWIVVMAAIYAVGLILQPWYLLNPVAGYALLSGALSQGLMLLGRSGRLAGGAATVALCALGLLTVQLAAYSPLFRAYDAWRAATSIADRYLDEVARKIEAAPIGTVVRVRGAPQLLPPSPDRARLSGVAILAGYSIDAWSRLSFPERRVRVVFGRQAKLRVEPDEVLVVLGAQPEPPAARGSRGPGGKPELPRRQGR